MLSHSKIGSAGEAAAYFKVDDYYSHSGDVAGQWFGEGARQLGLEGKASINAFQNALSGRGPDNQALGVTRSGGLRTPGWDFTFSPPKSISIMALAAGDKRLVVAHEDAVDRALGFAERQFAATRVMQQRQATIERTGNLLVSKFLHGLSREQDPQLHTHAVIVNATQTEDGKWRSLHSRALYDGHRAISTAYMNALKENVQSLGYDTVATGPKGERLKFGGFEIKGVAPDLIKAFSRRREKIESHLESAQHVTAKSKAAATLNTRGSKSRIDHDALRQSWDTTMAPFKADIEALRDGAQSAEHVQPQADVFEALDFAIEHLSDKDAVFQFKDVFATVFEHKQGRIDERRLEHAFAQKIEDGDLILGWQGDSLLVTSKDMLRLEADIIKSASRLSGMTMEYEDRQSFRTMPENALKTRPELRGLSDEQKDAIGEIVYGPASLMLIQGHAGVGKTTMLSHAQSVMKGEGRTILGVAPTYQAVKELQSVGIPAMTLEAFLKPDVELWDPDKTTIVLDESSMVGTRKMAAFFKRLEREKPSKTVLMGDSKQLQAINAGAPFKSLQSEFHTKLLTNIRRQQDNTLLTAAKYASEDRYHEALSELNSRVIEAGHSKLVQSAFAEWQALRQETGRSPLAVTATHDRRQELTHLIRNQLKAEGELAQSEIEIEVEASRTLSPAQQRLAEHYSVGDKLAFITGLPSQQLHRGSDWCVEKVDADRNQLLLLSDRSERRMFRLGQRGKPPKLAISRTKSLKLAKGDQVRFTRTLKRVGVHTGMTGKIAKIDESDIYVSMDDAFKGQVLKFERGGPVARALDHAYVVTTHAAQGATADSVVVMIDTSKRLALTKEQFYVQITRCKQNLTVVVDDKAELKSALSDPKPQYAAVDFVGHMQPVEPRTPEPVAPQRESKSSKPEERRAETEHTRSDEQKPEELEIVREKQPVRNWDMGR